MGKAHKLALSKRTKNWFIAGDWHAEHLHIPSFNILCKMAQSLPSSDRNLIINGDFFDAPYFMPKNSDFKNWVDRKDGVDEFFLPEFEKEMRWCNDTLDALQSIFKEIIYIDGNHNEPRVKNFRENFCPHGYKHNFNSIDAMNLSKRGIRFIPYNDWLFYGKLAITHGMYHGTSCHKKHYEASGARSVIFSHIHTDEVKSFTVMGETRKAWSLPAMCDLSPEYIKNSETNWTNGFGQFIMRPNGNFNMYIHTVWDEMVITPNGKLFYG